MRIFHYIPAIFGLMNLYVFWRMRVAFGPGKWQWAVLAAMAGVVWLFMQRRAVMGTAWETPVHTVVLVWVGFALITVSWLFFLDCARILAWIVDNAAGTRLGHMLRLSRSVPLALGFCALLGLYALFEAAYIRPVHLTITTNKLPPDIPRLRLAVMSDVHVNALAGVPARVERMARVAREAGPDMLLMLGDLVDTDMRGKDRELAALRSIKAPLGKFAVLGNHEAYSGLENALRFTRSAGFTVLRREAVHAGGIVVAGVDDAVFISGGRTGGAAAEEEACLELLRSLDPERDKGRFILLLRHRPGTHGSIAGLFDLQLSGHTHGGQIWPGRFFTTWANGFSSGLTTVFGRHGHSAMYISRGTGVWGPPMRLFTPPEVTVIDLVREPE